MRTLDRKPKVSVVIPCLNEEEALPFVYAETTSVLRELDRSYEILLVDDGSTDSTLQVARRLKLNDRHIRIIKLSRNYGHMTALHLGLTLAKGEFIVTMDADLQDPPEVILDFVRILEENQEIAVVQSYRNDRKSDSRFKRLSAHIYYKIIGWLTGISIVTGAADFRMMRRSVASDLANVDQPRVLRLQIPASGHRIEYFPITRSERISGETKYSTLKMLALAYDSIFDFSERPLRIMSKTALSFTVLFSLGMPISLLLWGFTETVSGWTSIVLLILLCNSATLLLVSLLGEYLSRIYADRNKKHEIKWLEV